MTARVCVIGLLVLFVLASASCSRGGSDEHGGKPSSGISSESERHAQPAAKPGSYEDWCEEHQVPESQCTRCNHDLVAAFKATGDWCDEHGLPESQCTKCNPDLKIARPPKPWEQ